MATRESAALSSDDVPPDEVPVDEVPVSDRVRSYVARNFLFQDDLDLAADESLLDAGILDSLGVMELVTFLEDEFAIRLEERELVRDNLDSIADITDLVRRHRGNGNRTNGA